MTNTVQDYHERSKHRLERYAPGPGFLDWANQPCPWRVYEGAERLRFELAADGIATRYDELRRGELPAPEPLDRRHLGILFEASLALSAWKQYGGSRWALRCNPSSGNLHPTEAYLLVPALPEIDPGVYHYLSRDHVLEARARPSRAWSDAFEGCVILALTSIHWREAWKYGMRAYRYCQHDCGHAIASVTYAAAALGWWAEVIEGPADEDIARLVGLDREADFAHVEPEAPEVLLRIGIQDGRADLGRLVPLAGQCEWRGRPNRLSDEQVRWDEIDEVAQLARAPRRIPCRVEAPPAAALPALPSALPATALFRQRRSAVAFDGTTTMSRDSFLAMLAALLPAAGRPPWSAWPQRPAVHPALFVHRVDSLTPGLYLFLRDESALDELRPAMRAEWLWEKVSGTPLPLYLLLPADLRDAARIVSCHQEIAADSCFSLGMLARLSGVEQAPWRYRELFWECGMIGQTLYLEAEAAGLRATGIGCYFDDEMHRVLGLRGGEWQSLYHFTVGGPLEDARLTTLPPYSAR